MRKRNDSPAVKCQEQKHKEDQVRHVIPLPFVVHSSVRIAPEAALPTQRFKGRASGRRRLARRTKRGNLKAGDIRSIETPLGA